MSEFFLTYLAVVMMKAPETLVIIGSIVAFAASFFWIEARGEEEPLKWMRRGAILAVVGIVMFAFVPTERQFAYIIGGGLALKAAQNEEMQELPENLVSAMNAFLERIDGED